MEKSYKRHFHPGLPKTRDSTIVQTHTNTMRCFSHDRCLDMPSTSQSSAALAVSAWEARSRFRLTILRRLLARRGISALFVCHLINHTYNSIRRAKKRLSYSWPNTACMQCLHGSLAAAGAVLQHPSQNRTEQRQPPGECHWAKGLGVRSVWGQKNHFQSITIIN